MYALCDWRETVAYQLMADVLLNEGDFVRSAAVWGLRECTDAQAVPVLAAAMQAADPEVRVKALDALSVNATPEAAPVVRRALSDPDPYVQYTATMSLLELVGPAGLPEIAHLITQSCGVSREHIIRGFFQAVNHLNLDVIHHPSAGLVFEALEVTLTDPYPPARMAAAWPLAWFDHDRPRSMLKQAYYGEQDDAVKAHFIHVAVNLLSPVGAELLKDGLRSSSAAVREKAEQIKLDIEAGAIVVDWEID